MTPKNLRHGDIWLVQCSPSVGHEYKDAHPAVIIQEKDLPYDKGLASVVHMSSYKGKQWLNDILVQPNPETNRLRVPTLIKVQHIQSYDTSRFLKKIGRLDDTNMAALKKYIASHFGL